MTLGKMSLVRLVSRLIRYYYDVPINKNSIAIYDDHGGQISLTEQLRTNNEFKSEISLTIVPVPIRDVYDQYNHEGVAVSTSLSGYL